MVFTSPSYLSKLFFDPPSDVPVHEFVFPDGDKYQRYPIKESRNPFTCGITGKTHSAVDVRDRVEYLARALASEIGAKVEEGTEMDKVVGVFTVNAVRTRFPLTFMLLPVSLLIWA